MCHVIYTKSNCKYCNLAKEWLKANQVDFEEQSLDDDEIKELFKKAYPMCRSVPVVFDPDGNLSVEWKGTTNV